MSPEQATGDVEHHSPLTDVYGLGATLFHILTGVSPHGATRPVERETRNQIYEQIANTVPPEAVSIVPHLPPALSSICRKALQPHAAPDIPAVAAVCVYPTMVKHAAKLLNGTPVRIASVATAFPSGQAPMKTRLGEVRQAVSDGADEIDMVINRSAFLCGELGRVQDEISSVLDACGSATLKVILETSELESYDHIRAASFLAMRVLRPGDFIKTSTGKTAANATLANNQVMLDAIRDHYLATGIEIGMKPAGGIRTAKQALHFLCAVKETLGDRWLVNSRYRFGASALLNDLLRQLETQRTGNYQAPWKFSEDATGY
jgi:deoxyribose-phosphate aldolase